MVSEYGKLRNQYSELIDPTQPLPTDTVEAQEVVSESNTLTYNGKDTIGGVSVNSTTFKPIVTVIGDQVASYWGLDKNKVYEVLVDKANVKKEKGQWLQSVVETNGSASVNIYDENRNLENLFESTTGTVKRYVLKVTDASGNSLYGWIFGVSVSGNVYTFNVVNNRLTETQNWVGTLASFDNTSLSKAEIFHYNTSLVFDNATVYSEEVQCPREYSKEWANPIKYAIDNLSNGQYFVDYQRGRIIGKRLAAGTPTNVVTYNIWASTVTGVAGAGSSDVNVEKVGGMDSVQIPLANGNDATGADAYATVLTPSRNARHIMVSLGGANPAMISLNAGVTDHIFVKASSIIALDDVLITSGTAIQAKNGVPGSNYSDLNITVW